MKISVNWLNQYLPEPVSPEKASELLTQTGLEVEGNQQWSALSATTNTLVTGRIVSVKPHPKADKLKITEVDTGENALRKIVCGAPNVATEQFVIIALPGTVFYENGKEKLTIKSAAIRGAASEGMICSEKELGISDDHSGIMLLKNSPEPGTPALEVLNVYSDDILEIGLTPNRGDGASHIGCARDLAAVLGQSVTYPRVDHFQNGPKEDVFSVSIEDPMLCKRYAGLSMQNVQVKPSPEWLQNYLKAIGLRPVNNLVDAATFVMLETGQPLHIFDRDKLDGNTIIVGINASKQSFETLDGKKHDLTGGELMIQDAKKPLAIAGVMGGNNSAVTETTRNIFLESAWFDPAIIRKTARQHQIFSDAAFRYERGVDPNLADYALKRLALLLSELSGATATSPLVDQYIEKVAPARIFFSFKYLNRLAGQEIPVKKVQSILEALDFEIEKNTGEGCHIAIPTFRTEVTRPADVAEEILRIYGYDSINPSQGWRSVIQAPGTEGKEAVINKLSDQLRAQGFNEIMTNSLTEGRKMEGHDNPAISVLNPLSRELDALRTSPVYTMLDSVRHNINRKNRDLKFFEIGKGYRLEDNRYTEKEGLHLMLTGRLNAENWWQNDTHADYFYLKGIWLNLVQACGLDKPLSEKTEDEQVAYGQSWYLHGDALGLTGRLSPWLLKKLDVEQSVFYAFLDLETLMINIGRKEETYYNPVNKYPSMRRDLSVILDHAADYESLRQVVENTGGRLLSGVQVFDVYEGEKIESGSKSYAVMMTFESPDQTLTDEEADHIVEKIISNIESGLKAKVRRS